ncbi:MAG: 7TM-DISM domain-containing protein, partial [Pseudomonadota bacterium]
MRLLLLGIIVQVLLTNAAVAGPIPLPITGDKTTEEISKHVWYAENYQDQIQRTNIMRDFNSFQNVKSEKIDLGIEGSPVLYVFSVTNPTSKPTSWVFTTRRHSVSYIDIYDISDNARKTLVTSKNKKASSENIRRFIGYGFV